MAWHENRLFPIDVGSEHLPDGPNEWKLQYCVLHGSPSVFVVLRRQCNLCSAIPRLWYLGINDHQKKLSVSPLSYVMLS